MRSRALVTSILASVVIVGGVASYSVVQSRRAFKPEVQILNEDYAATRSHFRTKLLREGPSPQREVFALRPPGYVDVVEYPSGALRLKAWLAGARDTTRQLPAVLFLHGGFEFGAAGWAMAGPYWGAGLVVMVPVRRGADAAVAGSRRWPVGVRAKGGDAAGGGAGGRYMSCAARGMPESIEFCKRVLGLQGAVRHARAVPAMGPSLVGNTTFTLRG